MTQTLMFQGLNPNYNTKQLYFERNTNVFTYNCAKIGQSLSFQCQIFFDAISLHTYVFQSKILFSTVQTKYEISEKMEHLRIVRRGMAQLHRRRYS